MQLKWCQKDKRFQSSSKLLIHWHNNVKEGKKSGKKETFKKDVKTKRRAFSLALVNTLDHSYFEIRSNRC